MNNKNDMQLSKLENRLKNKNADYSIYKDNFNLESAREGAMHYKISLP